MHELLNNGVTALPVLILAGSLLVWLGLLRRPGGIRPAVEYEPRALVPWSGLDLIVLGIGVLLLQAISVVVVADGEDRSTPALSTSVMTAVVGSRVLWFVLALVYLTQKARAFADEMGFDLRRWKYDLRLAGLTFLAAALPVYGTNLFLSVVLDFKSEHPLVKLVSEQPSLYAMVMATVAAVLVAPLVEEFLVRVLLQGWLETKQIESRLRSGAMDDRAGWMPIIVASTIFALLHGFPDMVPLFILSLFLGYAYQRTHRIIAPLIVHACVNAMAVVELWRLYVYGPQ